MKLVGKWMACLAFSGAMIAATVPAAAHDYSRWGGLYIGGSIGGAWSDIDVSNAGPGVHYYIPGDVYSFDNSGWLAGGHIGYNHQVGRWVFGVEAAFSGGDLDESLVAPGVFSTNTYRTDLEWLFTGTGRVGYTWDNLMAYVKAGYATGKITTFASEVPFFNHSGESNERHNGWVVGAGLEYLLLKNFVVGVEYNYMDLDSETHRGVDHSGFSTYDVKVDPDAIHTVMARLSFKFGRDEPRQEPLK